MTEPTTPNTTNTTPNATTATQGTTAATIDAEAYRAAREALMRPISINRTTIANRVSIPPMSLVKGSADGEATQDMFDRYAAFAQGGFGLLMTEGLYIDELYSQAALTQPGLVNDGQERSWRPIIDAAHKAGSKIFAQIAHIGSISKANRYVTGLVGPSAVAMSPEMPTPRALTGEEIDGIIKAFAATAARARHAGFDGVEIHAGHGLIQQFLSAATNQRDDEYGGDVEHRMRMLAKTVAAVREAVGPEFPVGVRIVEDKALDADETARFLSGLNAMPLDFIHTSQMDAFQPSASDPSATFPELVRRHTGKTLIATGMLGYPANAVKAMRTADMIAVGRMALANPDWVNRLNGSLPLNEFRGFGA